MIGATSNISVSGSFTQEESGRTQFQLGGLTAGIFGTMTVGQQATLAGTVELVTANSFSPAVGNKFKLMTFASVVGSFTTVLGNGLNYKLLNTPTDLTVERTA